MLSLRHDLRVLSKGYLGFDAVACFDLLASAVTPPAVVTKINADVAKALDNPEIGGKLKRVGVQLTPKHSQAEFATLINTEIPRIAELLNDSGIKLD